MLDDILKQIFAILMISVILMDLYFNTVPVSRIFIHQGMEANISVQDILNLAKYSSAKFLKATKAFHSLYAKFKAMLGDFRAHKYYIPWRSTKGRIIVTSKKHILELSEAPQLSQRAVYGDLFGFRLNMDNLDHNEEKKSRARLYGRVLRINGPTHLVFLYSLLKGRLSQSMSEELRLGKPENGWTSISLAPTLLNVTADLMGICFFGEQISTRNSAFMVALLQYYKDLINSSAAFQFTPRILSRFIHGYITNHGKAMHTVLSHLVPIFTDNDNWDEADLIKEHTVVYGMANFSKESSYWSPELLSQSILGIWFAALHQPWINLDFALLELCERPEYLELLRTEIGNFNRLDSKSIEDLPLLDSFIKESVRLNPLDNLAIRRKALKPFTFSEGGPHVAEGNMACVSAYDLMHNEAVYPDPHDFHGHRFLNVSSEMRGTKFTDVSEHFPIWGYGSLACPGRFHASLVLKLIIAYLVSTFDFKLADEKAARRFTWETFNMPFESTRILLRKRSSE